MAEQDPISVLKDRGLNVPPETAPAVVAELLRIVTSLWVEGRVVPVHRFHIDPADEGLLFGRGVWESTRTIGGVPWLWPWHIDRLKKTAAMLAIDVSPERLPDADAVKEYVRGLTSQDVVIRLNVTAGRPGKTGLVWMSAALQPMPTQGLRLQSVRSPVQKGQPYLTLKTFQYATRLRIGQQAHQSGFDTALLLDEQGNMQEAAHANLFVRLADGWFTPTADGGLMPGTVRQFLLQQSPIPMREKTIPITQLGEVQEAFVTNSNVGLAPVVQIDNHSIPVGADTTKLLQWLNPPTSGNQYRFAESRVTPR